MVSDPTSRHLVGRARTRGSEVRPYAGFLGSASPRLWGARLLIHVLSFYRSHMASELPRQGRLIAVPRLAAAQWPWALSCGHVGLQFLFPSSMTHSRCWGLQGPCDSIPLVSVTFQALVRTVARGVAQSAPVPTPRLCPALSPPRGLSPSPAAFWRGRLGVPSMSWWEDLTQLFPQFWQGAESLPLLWRLGDPRQAFLRMEPTPPPVVLPAM